MMANGKVALVTGAGSGIGRAASLALHAAGYSVVLAGRRAVELERTAASARMLPVPTDISQPDSVRALFAEPKKPLAGWTCSSTTPASAAPGIPMEDLTYEQWIAVVAVNLTGAFLCAQAAIKLMKAQQPRGGRIINNGSISAYGAGGQLGAGIPRPSTPSRA